LSPIERTIQVRPFSFFINIDFISWKEEEDDDHDCLGALFDWKTKILKDYDEQLYIKQKIVKNMEPIKPDQVRLYSEDLWYRLRPPTSPS